MTRKVLRDVSEKLVDGFVQFPAHGEGPWSYLGSPQCSVEYAVLQGYELCLGAGMLSYHGAADCNEFCFGPAELVKVWSLTAREFSDAVSVS